MPRASKFILPLLGLFCIASTWIASPGKGSHGGVTGGTAPSFKAVIEEALGSVTTTQSMSSTLNLATGDLVVVGVSGTSDATGVDVGGVAATKVGVNTSGGFSVSMWYLANTAANATALVTINVASSNFVTMTAASYSGAKTTSVLDQNACNVAACNALSNSTNITTQNVTTTQSNSMLVVWCINNDNKTYTPAGSWTKRTGSGANRALFDQGVTSTGSYPGGNVATVNSTADNTYWALIGTFKGL